MHQHYYYYIFKTVYFPNDPKFCVYIRSVLVYIPLLSVHLFWNYNKKCSVFHAVCTIAVGCSVFFLKKWHHKLHGFLLRHFKIVLIYGLLLRIYKSSKYCDTLKLLVNYHLSNFFSMPLVISCFLVFWHVLHED